MVRPDQTKNNIKMFEKLKNCLKLLFISRLKTKHVTHVKKHVKNLNRISF